MLQIASTADRNDCADIHLTIQAIIISSKVGGAAFAALIVLSAMDLPVVLAGLAIAIEPLIDMGRTALNVSGSITAGTDTGARAGSSADAAAHGLHARRAHGTEHRTDYRQQVVHESGYGR